MFFKKQSLRDRIASGDIFYRRMMLSLREQARVLRVEDDDQGIPHVHYEKTVLRTGYQEHSGTNVLALAIFERDFQEAQ
ncbi:hypothetical protein [Sneathiella sp. HT1-7]|uniref:hypothetical protein n=1 Tax=Sneathiella sp. HT1-7 TaxID=2887192 RepID=UPI001D138FD7|nr:hypothetical protein [Sneathiella sp. HT1-7]MCC3306144.1 hypothetical protein [Sneathiella sp. HT1-7]